jgi:two-component system sensor histidine kinase UhpB
MKVSTGTLYHRVFALNAAILIVATLAVAITPATVSFPVEVTEAIVLTAGLIATIVVNALVLRTVFAPLERLTRTMRDVDLHGPRERLAVSGAQEMRELVFVFNEMLDRLEEERRESGRRALAAQEGERRRVAQELHDEVGQALTGVLLRLESLARRAPEDLRAEVRAAQEATRETIDRVGLVVRQLRPEALTDLGLARALIDLASRVEDESGLTVRRRIAGDLDDLGEEAELVIYRIAQESLTNAVRHAHATEIQLSLERRDDRGFTLRVRDNGRGMPATFQPRHGIIGMRERAMLIGATLRVASQPEGGLEVTLTAPRVQ